MAEKNILQAEIRQQSALNVNLQRALKRFVDIIVAFLSLAMLSPVFALIALAINLTSPGPVFYAWHVVGKNGTRFTGYKFRTMVVNADELKKALCQ